MGFDTHPGGDFYTEGLVSLLGRCKDGMDLYIYSGGACLSFDTHPGGDFYTKGMVLFTREM